MQIISQNQDRFIQMLNEAGTEGGGDDLPGGDDVPGGEGAGGQGEGDLEGNNPGVNYIQVTPPEKEAIERVGCQQALPQSC